MVLSKMKEVSLSRKVLFNFFQVRLHQAHALTKKTAFPDPGNEVAILALKKLSEMNVSLA